MSSKVRSFGLSKHEKMVEYYVHVRSTDQLERWRFESLKPVHDSFNFPCFYLYRHLHYI